MSGKASWPVSGGKPVNRRLVIFTAIFVAVSAAEYTALFLWPGVAISAKVSVALAIIGVYGLGLGFLRSLEKLDASAKGVIDELASPNAALCYAGNMTYLGTLLHTLALAVPGTRSRRSPLALQLLMMLAVLIVGLGLFIYVVFHAVIVVPISYPAVLIAASVVNAYEETASDAYLTVTDSARSITSGGPLRDLVVGHKVAATAFIMGLPAAVLSLVGQVVSPFL
jgi:hypothetical protein